MTWIPVSLLLLGAGFLALAVLFVLDAKVVRPADRRDELVAARLVSTRQAARPGTYRRSEPQPSLSTNSAMAE